MFEIKTQSRIPIFEQLKQQIGLPTAAQTGNHFYQSVVFFSYQFI